MSVCLSFVPEGNGIIYSGYERVDLDGTSNVIIIILHNTFVLSSASAAAAAVVVLCPVYPSLPPHSATNC